MKIIYNHFTNKWKNWRTADQGFSYTMTVPPDEPVSLSCKFMGRNQHESWDCDIMIDSVVIAHLYRNKDDTYPVIPFRYCFPVTYELTTGKKRIQVVFQVRQSKMPRLMEVGILKMQDYPKYPVQIL
jgi:hypothetical protein